MVLQTLQATRCGQSFPKPKGGEIFLNKVITSRCLIRPLQKIERLHLKTIYFKI